MKKVILFILSLFMTIKVSAMTYYSDYNKEGITDIPINKTDLVEVSPVLKYEMYEEEINYVYLKDSNLEETGKTITTYTDWTTNLDEINLNEEIEKYYEYAYAPAKNYNYLNIKNVSENIELEYLEIYDSQNDTYIYKGPLDPIGKPVSLVFRLTSKTNLANIEIRVKSSNDDKLELEIYASIDFPSLSTPDYITTLKNNVEINDFTIYENIYPEVKVYIIEEFKKEKISDKYSLVNTYYRNKEIFKEYKQVIKNYLGIYSNNPEDLIDYEKSKVFYSYKLRDKVIINDNYTSIDDIISYSTIDNIEISKENNKIYIEIPFLDESLEYEIPGNNNEEIQENDDYILVDVDELNSLYDELDNAYYLVDKKNLEIKEMILQSDEYTDNIVDDLNNCYTEKNILKEQKKTLTEEKEVKKGSLYYIFIIILLSVFLAICRFMSTKKNI